jgi:hypothetical protein
MSSLRAILKTPITRLLRGQVGPATPPEDAPQIIAAAQLPPEIAAAIQHIIKRASLKKRERQDVARELTAHFQDALTADNSPAKALADFGDPKTAAKLIRRAKIRQRPLLWHLFRAVRWFIAAMLLLYLGLTIRFFLGKPTISVDYLAKLNEPALAAPESDRAWPIYRQVAARLMPYSMDSQSNRELYDALGAYPNWKLFPETRRWVMAHHAELATLRAATHKPVFGFIAGPAGSQNDPDLFGKTTPPTAGSKASVIDAIAGHLPQHSNVRNLANMLAADTRVAAADGDFDRSIEDVESILRMAGHVQQDKTLVGQLVAIGIRSLGYELAAEITQSHGSQLTEDHLLRLIAATTGPTVAADILTYEGERYFFHDFVQRIFTDDGNGDGRLTPSMRDSQVLGGIIGTPDSPAYQVISQDLAFTATGGLATVALGGRKELTDYYNNAMGRMEANLHLPLRQVTDNVEQQVMQDVITNIRLAPARYVIPTFTRPPVTAERTLAAQEAARLAAALQLHKLRTGQFPDSLTALIPNELPTLPVDRITGQPLQYHLSNTGQPLIYSVGADRDDDGGTPPLDRTGKPQPTHAAEWFGSKADGDWLLYPVPRPTEPDVPG